MATLTNPALSTSHDPAQFIGRSITWLMSTGGDFTADADMTQALRMIGQWCTIEVVGTATAAGCIFGVSGFPAAVPASLETALDTINAQALTIVTISALTFA